MGPVLIKVRRFPITEPLIKLIPIVKLIGKNTVLNNKKSTFALFELFCIPINRMKNRLKL